MNRALAGRERNTRSAACKLKSCEAYAPLTVFGITPKQFRAEQWALKALSSVEGWQGTGADLAADLGYVDQAHMIRSIRAITGKSPSCFRVK